MQQLLFIAGGAFLALQDGLANFKLSKQAKTIILAVVAYYFLNRFIQEQRKNAILDQAGSDPAANFAIRLRAAFHPAVDWGDWLPDGTDEAEVIAVAKAMKPYKNFAQVSQKYRAIYGNDLANELASEGVYNEFFQYYN